MDERYVSEKWVDWIGSVTGIPAPARYAYPVANVLAAPPIVAGVVDRKRTASAADEEAALLFPQFLSLQQVEWVRVFECSATILVEAEPEEVAAEAAEDAAKAAFQQLQAWGAELEASAWADDSLGERLGADPQTAGFISPALAFDYTPVYRELDDGTRGRTFVIAANIAEVIDLEPE